MGQKNPEREQKEETEQSRWGFRGMAVRDWLQLLIVPLALVVIGFLFTAQQDQRQQQIEDQRAQQAQKIEDQRAAAERELAVQRALDEGLQAYLDQMSNLLLERNLRESAKDSEVRTLARARTLTVLSRLDSARQERLLQFLFEAGLLHKENPVIDLTGADLRAIDLHKYNLSGGGPFSVEAPESVHIKFAQSNAANLSGAILRDANLEDAVLYDTNLGYADLTRAHLNGAFLFRADLSGAFLRKADLSPVSLFAATLSQADLTEANLSEANFTEATLSETIMRDANLSGANLSGADLRNADLSGADLSDAKGMSEEELKQQAASLNGAIMPDGQRRRSVTTEFEPALSYNISDGWQLETETTDELSLTGPEGGLIFTSPSRVFDPRSSSEATKVSAPENVDEWASWFQRHPKLDTSEPISVRVGGASGLRIDVMQSSTPENYPRDACREQPCVPLYPGIFSYPDEKDRFFIVEGGMRRWSSTFSLRQISLTSFSRRHSRCSTL